MGVKDLWQLTAPVEERVSLHSLRGSTLAIDLAGWVVQNQTAPGLGHSVLRPHLRNLFFRVHTLLSLDILPVIVLDGACPAAKSDTVQARNRARGLGGVSDSPKRQHRRQFAGVLRDCGRLVASLGVPCVTAPGEAEAYCAWLDRAGLVDAVVSDDSDCFCYGARTVLRNFSTDPKNFCVTRCTAGRLRAELGLSRERLVVMALLLGSDYNPGGVAGVGREGVVRLFAAWGAPAKGELEDVLGWTDDGRPEETAGGKPVHCGTCGHPGTVGSHRKAGCTVCGLSPPCRPGLACPCAFHSPAHQLALAIAAVRRRAVACPGWPFR
jgi:flap endonuclease GEN